MSALCFSFAAATAAATERAAANAQAAPAPAEQASAGCPESRGEPCGNEGLVMVVLGTRTPESVQRSTIRTGVVTREEAERRGARNVGEALAGETSLQVNPEAYGYLGRPSALQMQGLDAERVLILEDGERVSGDVGGVIDLSRLPLTDVERIEYVMGPTSSLYGSNALGGVVNVVTAPPSAEGTSGRGRLEARSRGELLGEGSVAYREGGAFAVADVLWERSPEEPLPDPERGTLAPSRSSRLLGLRLGASLQRRAQLQLKLRWVHDELVGSSSEQVPGLGAYVISLPDRTDRFSVRARETLRLGAQARLDFSLGRSWFRGEAGRDRDRSPVDEIRRRELDAQSFESALTVDEGTTRTWVVGIRSETEQFEQRLQRTELRAGQLETRRAREVAPTQLGSGALFGQLAWALRHDIKLLAGSRAELHDRYGVIVAPRLAVAFRVDERLSVRAALGRGFRAPSAKEYGFVFDHSAIGYRVLGNRQLAPERSWGVTSDASFRPRRWLLLRGGAFANRISELIGTDLAPEQPQAGITDYTYVNVARAYTAGADAAVRLEPVESMRFAGGYAYLWTCDAATGDPLPNRPAHTVTLSVDATPAERVELNARYRRVSSSFVAPEVRSPGHGLLDLRVSVRVWREVRTYAGVLNLLDARKEPEQLGDARPALGRNFYVGVSGNLPGYAETRDAD